MKTKTVNLKVGQKIDGERVEQILPAVNNQRVLQPYFRTVVLGTLGGTFKTRRVLAHVDHVWNVA